MKEIGMRFSELKNNAISVEWFYAHFLDLFAPCEFCCNHTCQLFETIDISAITCSQQQFL
jgi:hypothetical protein